MKKGKLYKQKVHDYMDSVLSGRRSVGELERLAVERQVNDIRMATEKGIYFDEKAAIKAMVFFSLLKHYKGEWAGKEFELEGWQCFIVWCVFGWMKTDGVRRYNYVNVEVARKNGKTTFAAGLGLLMMILDEEASAEVYSAAVDREQAKICWRAASEMSKASPLLANRLKHYQNSIVMESNASYFQPLSRDSKNKDGLNPHCAICDEMHAWQNMDVFDVINSGMGARRQPMIISITTAGTNMSLPYFQMRKVYIDILRGIKQSESTFVLIFSPDKDDDWREKSTWEKASPALGKTVSYVYMERRLEEAINNGGRVEVEFKTKNCNMWVDAPDVWISDDIIAQNDDVLDKNVLIGKECYGGLDLASHVDINALALYFPEQNVVKLYCWVPEEKLLSNEDIVDYRLWHDQGYLRTTPGDAIDIKYITTDILELSKLYNIKNISFDPYKAYHGVVQGLQNGGMADVLDPYQQSIANMSEPSKELERLLIERKLNLLSNPVLRWMFRNVVMYVDANGNIRPDKKKSQNKIDGVVALINAVGGWMSLRAEKDENSIYTNHNLRTISWNN